MKKFIIATLSVLFLMPALAEGPYEPSGDDLFPWPNGGICPLPIQDLEGTWIVRSPTQNEMTSEFFVFESVGETGDLEVFRIYQADRQGYLIAEGVAHTEDGKYLSGILTPYDGGVEFLIVVQTHASEGAKVCSNDQTFTTISFCPMGAGDCHFENTHLLEKIQP